VVIAVALSLLAAPAMTVDVNRARLPGGWNCASHRDMARDLGREGYRLFRRRPMADGQIIEIWRNIAPPEDRRPDRDEFIRVRHSRSEDCTVRETNTNG
jgi:hypothetical protein